MKYRIVSQSITYCLGACILWMCGPAQAQLPKYVRTEGLYGWYSFDSGDANDDGPGNNHLQNLGVTFGTDRFNNPMAAAQFDGSATYLRKEGVDFGSDTDEFAISLWFLAQNDGFGTLATYGDVQNPGVRAATVRYISNPLPQVEGRWGSDSGVPTSTTTDQIQDQNWHHIVFYRNGSELFMYMDGEPVAHPAPNSVGYLMLNLKNFHLGTNLSLSDYWGGKLDDVGFWPGHAGDFSQCDVLKLYLAYDYSDLNDQFVAEGNTATFELANNSDVSFQWQVNSGTGWQDVSNAGQYSGATTNSLTVSNVTNSNDNYIYRCVIDYGSGCTENTNEATLNVGTSGIFDGPDAVILNLYPNPSNGQFLLNLDGTDFSNDAMITVLDNTGRIVFSSPANGLLVNLDLRAYADGMYQIQVIENGKLGTARFHKMN